jgi:DUF1680 family protein
MYGTAALDDADLVLPQSERSFNYVANRHPLIVSAMTKLPPGLVQPKGWLKKQLELEADGMVGHMTEISRWCQFDESAWVSPGGQGKHPWEEMPYWLKGYASLAYVLQDDDMIAETQRWVDGILSTQRDDGYFGPEANRHKLDLWPNMIALYVLRTHYEATGDERVLPFMLDYFKWMESVPFGQLLPSSWQKWRAGDNLDSIYWLYNHTGEKWLLDVARVNHERTADWVGGIPTWHGVNLCQCFREPALYFQQTGDVRYLRAAIRNYETFMGIYGQVPGGMFGADENCRQGYTGPRQAAETCSMVEFMHSFELLSQITGHPVWADRCEEVAYNSLTAAMTPDLKGLHYLTAPNMIQLDRQNKSPLLQNGGDMLSYTPYAQYRCCQHNVAFGWPYFAERLWMATLNHGLAAVFYTDCEVTAKVGEDRTEVTIRETTDYPFDGHVTFDISLPEPTWFQLSFRLPTWCEKMQVTINGKAETADGNYFVSRRWQDGDVVELDLPMPIRIKQWKENNNTLSVHRGPLAFSLQIDEQWREYENGEPWAAWEVFPGSPWNYGLMLDATKPESSVALANVVDSISDQPWTVENAPVSLTASAKRIPGWTQEPNGLIGAVQPSPVHSEEPVEQIKLIPMGCARLRVSAFPQVSESPAAARWNTDWIRITASHMEGTKSALNDGKLPKSSSDSSIDRLTFWPHRGTAEWVQYEFARPQEISFCEVYWYDDTGRGKCRIPARWKILHGDGASFEEVTGASSYPTEKDAMNRVTFDPIKTRYLRLWVECDPVYTAGMLEWRYGH